MERPIVAKREFGDKLDKLKKLYLALTILVTHTNYLLKYQFASTRQKEVRVVELLRPELGPERAASRPRAFGSSIFAVAV